MNEKPPEPSVEEPKKPRVLDGAFLRFKKTNPHNFRLRKSPELTREKKTASVPAEVSAEVVIEEAPQELEKVV